MTTQPLESAISSARGVLGNVKTDQLDDSTPCASWKVRDLINHIVGGQAFFTAGIKGEPMSGGDTDYASGDFVGDFDRNAKECVAAFSEQGAMERMCTLPFGTMPGSAFVNLAATDTFVHGWDLAKATGQDTDLDPQLAAGLLAGSRAAISDAVRGDEPMPFAKEQKAPAVCSAADELAAFLGRTV
jgi:uncharacterized protein (TIGR03086 family)